MTASERRMEIIRIMISRRSETMARLAAELGVSLSTINRDICALTVDYPLETKRGGGGCVYFPDWYHPHRNMLSREQQNTLMALVENANEEQSRILKEMLEEYGSPKIRQAMEGCNR